MNTAQQPTAENGSESSAARVGGITNRCIRFKGGYKFQLKANCFLSTGIRPSKPFESEFVSIYPSGLLKIMSGYAWDGPSGPTVATLSFMRGSLVHDALYQLMREGGLDRTLFREQADQLLREICREDGMWSFRAWYVYWGVRFFGDPSADPAQDKNMQFSPGCEAKVV